ncbi:MAG: phosphodiester glycosidase family protein [Bacilli bacterium]
MNKKKLGLVLLWISNFFIITLAVLFVIGNNSNYLISEFLNRIILTFLIIFILVLLYSVYLLIRFKKKTIFKKWKTVVVSVLLSIYLVGCSSFVFVLYGPVKNFREWLITTAMATMNHQYYCKWFYNSDTIKEVLGDNYIKDFDEDTDSSLIDKVEKPVVEYKNEFEKAILEREENADYKIINFTLNGCKAYLAAVYDPSKVKVGVSKGLRKYGRYAADIAKDNKAILAINGGGFWDPGYNSNGSTPIGVTIKDSKIITDNENGTTGGVIGMTHDNVLVLLNNKGANEALKLGVRDAVSMNPFLIVNGKNAFTRGNGGWGYAARTAIGQRKDGIVLFLVVDSNEFRTKGASMVDLTEIMANYGAINAANLDGGTSSVMVVDGKMINDPIDSTLAHQTRGIPTIFMVTK